MKKREIFWYGALCVTLLLLMDTDVSGVGWEDMEVLKYDFEIATSPPRNQWYPEVEYNSIDNEFMVLWRSDGPIREDCDPGDEYECTGNFHSIDGQRVSTDGELLGDPIQLISPNEGYKNGARFAHNMFTNEYMTANPVSPTSNSLESEILIARINNVGDIQYGPTALYPSGGGESPLPIVVFNPVRREYLVVYSDRNIYNAHLNLIGFILNEGGNPIHGPFPVGNQLGDYYAPRGAYNPNDDNYLVVWEDFRNVADWLEPCDIYGVLLDNEGNMIVEIPVMDDAGMPGEKDQRVPVPVYNPDKNEFLVVAKTAQFGLISKTGTIFGRFINADDGTLPGPAFTIVDEPRIQHWPNIEYIEEEKKYFIVWNDCRNDGLPLEDPWYLSPAIDVYARWLDDTGSPIGDEILIAEREGEGDNWKQVPTIAYSPVKKRFLITWYDRHAAGGDTPFAGAPSDVRATLYGVPNPCAAKEIYGKYSKEVEFLRQVRDNVLSQTEEGRELIRLYYQWSPVIVKAMEEDDEFKEEVKEMIDGILPLIRGEVK